MSTARKMSPPVFDLDAISKLDSIHEIRNFYHAVDIQQTFAAINALKRMNTPDSSRELIQLYGDCLWRETKIHILDALRFHDNQRSLEFLFQIARSDFDLPLAHLAIESLGSTNNILATRFLEHLFRHGHKTKKPQVVMALVKLGTKIGQTVFLEELALSIENKELQLGKNLVYALGELKCHAAKKTLIDLLKRKDLMKELRLSALVSLAKLSREISDFDDVEILFKDDSFEHQIFQQSLNQVAFRSNWKLEDYLTKIFQGETHHKNLALELNAFKADDVFAGIQLFFSESQLDKLFSLLAKLNFKETTQWYEWIFGNENLTDEKAILGSQSLAIQNTEAALEQINKISAVDNELAQHAAVTALPRADIYFKDLMSSEKYKLSPDAFKIRAINRLGDFAMTQNYDVKLLLQLTKFLENELLIETSYEVKARIVRCFAQCRLPSNKLFSIFKTFLDNPIMVKSLFYYFEHHPSHQSFSFLNENSHKFKTASDNLGYLKALAAQEAGLFTFKDVRGIIEESLHGDKGEDTQAAALKFLAKNHFVELKTLILARLKTGSPVIVLNALIALKNFKDEELPDVIAPFLSSGSESIKGRALDTLLGFTSVRARRLALDFLKSNLNNLAAVDKVLKTLAHVTISSDYFLTTLDMIIKQNPEHAAVEDFKEFKVKIENAVFEGQVRSAPSALDLVAIDQSIESRLGKFQRYDEAVKVSLRSAEMPFSKPELFDEFVDKSVCVLGFTKAIDIFFDRHFGKKLFYPKIESRLHEFQNLLHVARLNEDHVDHDKLIKILSLEKYFTAQSLPVHKMTLIAKGFLNSKMLNDQFKIIDGLRAWGILLLLFGRKSNLTPKPIIAIDLDEASCALLAKKLMWLQDLRNPVAHRHTLTSLDEIKEIREEAYSIMRTLETVFM